MHHKKSKHQKKSNIYFGEDDSIPNIWRDHAFFLNYSNDYEYRTIIVVLATMAVIATIVKAIVIAIIIPKVAAIALFLGAIMAIPLSMLLATLLERFKRRYLDK